MKFDKRNNFNDIQEKKRKLLSKVKVSVFDKQTVIDVDNESDKYKKLYRKIKKDLDKSQKRIDELEKMNKDMLSNNKVNDSEIEKLKRKCSDYYEEVVELKSKLNESRNIINEKMEENHNLKVANKDLSFILENKDATISNLTKALKSSRDQNISLKKSIRHIADEKKMVIENEIVEKDDIISELNGKLNRLSKDLLALERENFKFNHLDPEYLIERLYNSMDMNNVFRFRDVVALHKKFRSLRESKLMSNASSKEKVVLNEVLGTVVIKNEEEMIFKDIDGNEYNAISNVKYKINDNDVASAIITDDIAKIKWVHESMKTAEEEYEIENRMNSSIKEYNEINEQVYEFLGNFKVLIITSRNGNRFARRLNKHGLECTWLDSLEKSPVHIREKMKSSDIVIICTYGTRHLVLDLVEEKSDKYQIMKNPNENDVVVRVKYALRMLDLK